ncbi:MAG: two component sensor histidine kinase [Pseudobdellovibrio sp.]|nr:two component sensor histidine kinase [Pseudobdellovibrio sp.]
MAGFKQTHSIAKRLVLTIVVIASLFLLEFVGMYFASQNTISGLGDLHLSIRSITQVRQLRTLLTTEQEMLKKASLRKLTDDEVVIFKNTEDQINTFFDINLNLARNSQDVFNLISDARSAHGPVRDLAAQVISQSGPLKVSPLIIDQYILETQDLLGKVQLVLANDSDHIFSRVYNERFTPLIVGMALSLLFVLFALWLGMNLKNKIETPIRELISTTNMFADGNLKVRATVGDADEIGALTVAFNSMAAKLEESMNERERTSKDLLDAKEAAEAANMAKSAFLANMSHEIRTPLGAVLGFSDLVIDPNVKPSEKANFLAAVKRNGELLSNIINDILDLSKIEAGKMQIVTHDVSLMEVLTDTKTLLDLQASDKGIALNVIIAENVPEKIKTDPLRLRQILINIVGNAIKFTAKGSVDIKISPVMSGTRSLLAFTVTDTGTGIRADQVNKLFAPFSQADVSTKRKYGGTGLGLVLSKRFANLLGGDVVLTESTPDKGSTFTITIDPGPVQTVVGDTAKTKLAEMQKSALRLDGIKVLLAEDSVDNQTLVTRFLKLAGASVEIASDGREATQKAKSDHYDVLLMDLQMPVMDGYEATSQLRRDGYRGKIVALTAHALSEERERCLKSGFDDHISKPVNRDLLIERVYHCAKDQAVH